MHFLLQLYGKQTYTRFMLNQRGARFRTHSFCLPLGKTKTRDEPLNAAKVEGLLAKTKSQQALISIETHKTGDSDFAGHLPYKTRK